MVKGVADGVLDLMSLELFMEIFPDLHVVLLMTLKKMVYCFCCLVAGGADAVL